MDADKDTTSPVSGGSPVPGGPAASGGGSLSSSPTAKAPGGATTAQPLPAPPPNFSGSSLHQDNNVKAEVSNKAGYLCHVDVTAEWDVPPAVIFSLFTYPDNSALFRDVKKVGQRKVVRAEPGFKVVELEQLGELVIMWIRRSYTTWLRVEEDSRHPAAESPLTIQFDLIKSDVLTKFSGQWVLSAVKDPATGEVVGTHAVLTQDVLPAGVPPFLQHVPLLGGLLRGVSLRAVRRVMEDLNAAVKRVKEAFAEGKTIDEFLRATCGVHDEVVVHQDSSSAVRSFAFDCDGEDDDDEKDSKKKKEQQRLKESPSGKGASLVGGSQPASPRSMRLASQTSLGLGPSPLGSAPLGSAPLPHQ